MSVIVGHVAHGAPVEEVLKGYPDLEPEDVCQALEYAAGLTQEEVHTPETSGPACPPWAIRQSTARW